MTTPPDGQPDQPHGTPPPPPPPGGWTAPGHPPPGYAPPGYAPPGAQPPYGYPPYDPSAPFGRHPVTGMPYSDKSKLVAGLLQLLLPLGIGRFYAGQTGLGVAQLLVTIFTCGIGALWPFIDGIVMLAGNPVDAQGRLLRG